MIGCWRVTNKFCAGNGGATQGCSLASWGQRTTSRVLTITAGLIRVGETRPLFTQKEVYCSAWEGLGCRVVSCSGSSRSSSSHTAASEPAVSITAAADVAEQQQTGLYITVTAEPPSPMTVGCFPSTLSLDADASERLLPQPARAAARAAAVDSAGGAVIVHRKFLTLHRRKKRKPAAPMAPHKALLDDLYPGPTQSVLERVGDWNFNAFALDSVTGGRPVSVLCVYLLHRYNLINIFHMDTVTVWKCFSLIEEGYHTTNPYHNALHAADVTQAMHCYLQESKIREHMTPMEMLAALLAAVCHDLDHPGVNQPFLIATDNHLAALYKNLSVLENHHWRCAMGCLWESGLLDGWPLEEVEQLQDQIRSLILATDITRQQEFLTRFKKYQDSGDMDMEQPECRHFSLQIALKCADICNPCRPWEVSHKWSQKICDEFYRQGDYERQLNLPVTTMCDRYATSVAKIQTGFIEYVVSPLFGAWHEWLGTTLSSCMMRNLRHNLQQWQERLAEDALPKNPQPLALKSSVEDDTQPEKCEEALKEVLSRSSSSSGDTGGETLGELKSQPVLSGQQTVVGRRHSLPLNVPSMLPRTVMRRESLSSDGQHPFILETIHMEGMSLSALSQADAEAADKGMVSIVTRMSDSSSAKTTLLPGSCHSKPGRRRLSLPQLSTYQYRNRQPVTTLQPLPATPSVEELRVPGFPPVKDNEGNYDGQHEQGSEGSKESACESSMADDEPTGCEGSSGCSDQGVGEVKSVLNIMSDARTGDNSQCSLSGSCVSGGIQFVSSSTQSMSTRTNNNNSGSGFTAKPSDISITNSRRDYPLRFSRRASLDSNTCTNINLNENLNLQSFRNENLNLSGSIIPQILQACHEVSGKWPKRSTLSGDKENRAPNKGRPALLARTRYWRSLNQEDASTPDPLKTNLTKTTQQMSFHQSPPARGRRGSAPVLQLDGFKNITAHRADVKAMDASPDRNASFLTTRRASAPANQVLMGITDHLTAAIPGHPSASAHQPQQPLGGVPSSHPSELPSSVASRLGLDPLSSGFRAPLSCGGGAGGDPYYDSSRGYEPKDIFNDGFGSPDCPRESPGVDILADMYRFRHECGMSQESSDDMGDWYSSSGGGETPSTPGCPSLFPGPPRHFHHHHYHHHHHHHLSNRRGSLPCNFSFSGDMRLLETS
ncbi:3'5'-cyclic nucleotide phosphodiesterase catalytic domain [Trinorchestia longiramus]|nr:3'5'-cyclic nucleotide phosphodiesterase catalytic domain [Trinorchestia longiramus]